MCKKIRLLFCLIVLLLLFGVQIVQAQDPVGWTAPIRLSSEEGQASEAFMVADQFGYLHVFWIESELSDNRSVIQYARFDGEDWAGPLDIFATPPGGTIGYVSPAVDEQGVLHLAWTGSNSGPVFYTTAPAHDALSARQWVTPYRIDIPAYRVKLKIDPENRLHVLYGNFYGQEPGVYYIRSEDGAATWTPPIWLDPDIPANRAPFDLALALDDAGGVHAAWNYLNLDQGFEALRYTHSRDGGDNWDFPIEVDEADESDGELRRAKPGMIVQGQNVHIIWAGTQDTNREHRFSTDAGQTWSVPVRIFGNFHGEAIGDGLAVDALGRMHFVAQIRWPMGIWHAYWDQNHWSVPSMVYYIARSDAENKLPTNNRVQAHHVRLAIRGGNQLVTTFTNAPGESEPLVLYAVHHTLNDVTSIAAPIPTSTPVITPTPLATGSTPTPLAVSSIPTRPKITETAPELTSTPAPTYPLWLGLTPVLVLLGGAIVFQLFRKR